MEEHVMPEKATDRRSVLYCRGTQKGALARIAARGGAVEAGRESRGDPKGD